MALTNKQTVEVRQVANGYIVMPTADMGRAQVTTDDDRLVFQTFAELAAWLGKHFTHRGQMLKED